MKGEGRCHTLLARVRGLGGRGVVVLGWLACGEGLCHTLLARVRGLGGRGVEVLGWLTCVSMLGCLLGCVACDVEVQLALLLGCLACCEVLLIRRFASMFYLLGARLVGMS